MQRHGLDFSKIATDLKEIDGVVEQLISYYQKQDCNIILLSEYGITNVNHPIHLNRILRKHGYLEIREERGLELLDAGASKAFAVADHQIAHIYLNDITVKDKIISILKNTDGIENVFTDEDLKTVNIDHHRCGDIVVVADKNAWFTYYFWLDDNKAPDYARMVDIHKKPGYDPVEMHTDPKDKFLMPKIIWKLLKKKLGFRTIMDIIPIDATLIKGSHGRIPESVDDYPVFISNNSSIELDKQLLATNIYDILQEHVIGQG